MPLTYSSQIFSNNAQATLVAGIGPLDTSIAISDASRFPLITSASDFFLVTLDDGYNVEVIRVQGLVGNTLTNCVRGTEGTASRSFPSGTPVEIRVTAGTLTEFCSEGDILTFISSLDDLSRPSSVNNHTYVSRDPDDAGNPILVVADRSTNVWSFPGFPNSVYTDTSDATAATTSVAYTSPTLAGRFVLNGLIIQFTSGFNKGACRKISAISGGRLQWSTPLASAPSSGDSFKVYQSLSSRLVQIEQRLTAGSL